MHFESVAECKKCHDAAQGKVVRGQQILVQFAKKRKEDVKKAKKEAQKGLYLAAAGFTDHTV